MDPQHIFWIALTILMCGWSVGGRACDVETSVGPDVTVVVCMKEVPGVDAVDKLMSSIPPTVQVLYVQFNPCTSVDIQATLDRAEREYPNLRIIRDLPPYSNIGDARRYAVSSPLVLWCV